MFQTYVNKSVVMSTNFMIVDSIATSKTWVLYTKVKVYLRNLKHYVI